MVLASPPLQPPHPPDKMDAGLLLLLTQAAGSIFLASNAVIY